MRTKGYLNSVQYVILLFSFNVPADSAEGTNSRRPLGVWCWENRLLPTLELFNNNNYGIIFNTPHAELSSVGTAVFFLSTSSGIIM